MWWVFLLTVATASTAPPSLPPPPHLNGRHFRITVLEEGDFLDVIEEDDENEDGISLSFSGYLIDMVDALAAKNLANFTYDLLTPSGLGEFCEPQLQSIDDENLYSAHYRSQYNCGTNDVNDITSGNISTDLYLGMYYISPERQLRNHFTIPFAPPHKGTPAMYGTATGIRDIPDLVRQQKQGKQPEVWMHDSTATLDFVQSTFPDLKIRPYVGSIDEAMDQGEAEISIVDAPLVTNKVLRRFRRGACLANGKAVGLIGEPMSSGLSHYAIGVSKNISNSIEVVDTLSYWLNILMICDPNDKDGVCPEGNLATFHKKSGGTGRECGYVLFPPDESTVLLAPGAIAGIILVGVGLIVFLFGIWHYRKLRQQEIRYKKRFVQQIARNIVIGPSPGHISPEKLSEEILHIGQGKSVIRKEDLAKWMHDIKLDFISEKDFDALWNAMDVNGKGEVDPVEFIVFLSACGPEFEKVYKAQENLSKIERLKLAARRLTNLKIHGEEGVRRLENKLDRSSREMVRPNKLTEPRGCRFQRKDVGGAVPSEQFSSRTLQLAPGCEDKSHEQSV